MMQPCASAAKLRGGGPFSKPVGQHHGLLRVTPPRVVIGDRRSTFRQAPKACSVSECLSHAARNITPVGTSPVVTRRHRAISNLRASATIIVLRFLPAFAVRARYHWVNALSFWWSKK